jgi:hypothetical protein
MPRGRPFLPGQSGNPKGKPKGAISKKRREVQDIAHRLAITPAELMLRRMVELWERGTDEAKDKAVEVAAMVAPYVHPRLAAQQLNVQQEPAVISGEPMTVEEWQEMVAGQRSDTNGASTGLGGEGDRSGPTPHGRRSDG